MQSKATEWQRKTAINKFNDIKAAVARTGAAKPDKVIADDAGRYVGVPGATVMQWIKGL